MSEPSAKNAHLWARHPEDWYVEPEWCSQRLFAEEPFEGEVADLACGLGRIVRAAHAAGLVAWGSDIVERAPECLCTCDFRARTASVDNIVSNPPFAFADEFARQALTIARQKVALLLPTKWMNGGTRGRWLETTPLFRVWLMSPRPSMPPGPVIESGERPGNGTVDFAWFLWLRGFDGAPTIRFLRRDA